jgi:Tol biopolymer transport system component
MRCTQWVLVAAVTALPGMATPHGRAPDIIATLPQREAASPATGASVSVSADGRHVAFVSHAKLVDADTNLVTDIYVVDMVTKRVTLETLTPDGQATNGGSMSPRLDGSGRYLVFESVATTLTDHQVVPGVQHVFLRDRVEGTTRLLSVDAHDRPANDSSYEPAISLDGGAVAFTSAATTLVTGEDRNGRGLDVYLARLPGGAIQRVSVTSAGEHVARGTSFTPSLSGNGRFVAFSSTAALTCERAGGCQRGKRAGPDLMDVYIHDIQTGRTTRVSQPEGGDEPNGRSFHAAISADGRFVAFASDASNLVRGDRNGVADVFVADVEGRKLELVSRTPTGKPVDGRSDRPTISADGSRVAFQSRASDLVCASRCGKRDRDVNMVWDVFLHDRRSGQTVRLSADDGDEWMEPSGSPQLAASGNLLAFSSLHPARREDVDVETHAYLVRLPAVEATRRPARTSADGDERP